MSESETGWNLHHGDVRDVLPRLDSASVDCCVTSPPYWGLRDYGVDGQLGLEPTPAEYVENMVRVFCEVRRVLKDDGTLWLNLGSSYMGGGGGNYGDGVSNRIDGQHLTNVRNRPDFIEASGFKAKDLVPIPWMLAMALQADGWYLRSDIIWHKPNPMPESVTDRPTKAHEYLFLMSKSERYYYDKDAIADPALNAGKVLDYTQDQKANDADGDLQRTLPKGRLITVAALRNKRTVWTICSEPYAGAHFAVMPTALVKPCVLAGCRTGGTVLDPFTGSGTVGLVAMEHGCNFVGVELNPEYVKMATARLKAASNQTRLFT